MAAPGRTSRGCWSTKGCRMLRSTWIRTASRPPRRRGDRGGTGTPGGGRGCAAPVAIPFANTPSALRVLHSIHELEPTLPVIVRTVDDADLEKLIASGATEVIPEIVEGSLMLASHTLVLMGVPMRRVVRRVEEMRDERYSMLRGYFHGADDAEDDDRREQVRLQSVPVDANADAVGRTLDELGLVNDGVEVTAIRRHGIRGVEPDPDTKLRASDIVVMRGLPEALSKAEERLSRNRRAGAVA